MKDMVFNTIDTGMWSAASGTVSDSHNQVAAIADLWQFWIDSAMSLTVVMPPGDSDFSLFPFGEDVLGRGLFEVIGIAADHAEALAFSRRFEFRRRILNMKFVRKNENGIARTLLVSGLPLWNDEGGFEGYRCTVTDITNVVTRPHSR